MVGGGDTNFQNKMMQQQVSAFAVRFTAPLRCSKKLIHGETDVGRCGMVEFQRQRRTRWLELLESSQDRRHPQSQEGSIDR